MVEPSGHRQVYYIKCDNVVSFDASNEKIMSKCLSYSKAILYLHKQKFQNSVYPELVNSSLRMSVRLLISNILLWSDRHTG